MKIAVLGTGAVGRALSGRLADLGHQVTVGTRDPAATGAVPEYAAWADTHPSVGLAAFSDAASEAELVVNATSGAVSLEVLRQAGAEHLAGKVLLDVSNPLDFSGGFPPTLSVSNTDSIGEQIQRAFPQARVVKSLNTMNNSVMIDPGSLGESTSVFLSGDDDLAKVVVRELLGAFGHDDVIDLGDITTSRGVEMLLALWVRLMGPLGTATFNFKVVR
ncbi:NADPH-dependent F420 reductase [Nocardioides sp.]|uniref:NADPH-dependent F420 reductase n=1 Tax=Nocardioides sp. TaxID=35761 RepID=UPI003D0A2261